jgi:hypothetical protein
LIHLSVVGHFGCFHSLAIVNSTAINMVCRCFCNSLSRILLGISIGVVLLDHMADLCLVFLVFFFTFFLIIHMCIQSLGHLGHFSTLPPPPPLLPTCPLPLPPTPSIPSRNYFALISNFVEERV